MKTVITIDEEIRNFCRIEIDGSLSDEQLDELAGQLEDVENVDCFVRSIKNAGFKVLKTNREKIDDNLSWLGSY